jgi:hypothetical protein
MPGKSPARRRLTGYRLPVSGRLGVDLAEIDAKMHAI